MTNMCQAVESCLKAVKACRGAFLELKIYPNSTFVGSDELAIAPHSRKRPGSHRVGGVPLRNAFPGQGFA